MKIAVLLLATLVLVAACQAHPPDDGDDTPNQKRDSVGIVAGTQNDGQGQNGNMIADDGDNTPNQKQNSVTGTQNDGQDQDGDVIPDQYDDNVDGVFASDNEGIQPPTIPN